MFGASYARLANAAREDPDPLPEVQDPSRYLAAALEAFSKVGREGLGSCSHILQPRRHQTTTSWVLPDIIAGLQRNATLHCAFWGPYREAARCQPASAM